jgi:BMFP domain-containing protein YqiC
MFDPKQLEEVANKLFSVLPQGFKDMEAEVHQKFKSILQSAFSGLDLVTREEFDVQVKVLSRTREKVEHLQAELEQLLKREAE